MHAGLKKVPAENTDHEQAHKQDQDQAMERATSVKPFRNEVRNGDRRAPLLDDKIAMDDDLGCRTGMSFSEEADHFVREKGGAGRKGEEDDRTEPHCRVDDGNDP